MENKKALNTIAIIGAVVLSIALVLVSVLTPLVFSLTRLTSTETVVKIVQEIDYEKILHENKQLENVVNAVGVDTSSVNDIMQSHAAGEVLSAYAETANAVLLGLDGEHTFNAETIKTIVNNNMDELANMTITQNGKKLPKEQVKAVINDTVNRNAEAIVAIFPDTSALAPTVETVKTVSAIKNTFSPLTIVVLLVSALLLAAAIFVLRRKKLKGLLLLGIDFFIAALLLGFLSISARIGIDALDIADLYAQVFGAAATFCTDRLTISIFTVLLLAVGFIVAYMLITGLKNNNDENKDSSL